MYVIMYHYVRNLQNSRYPKIKGLELQYFKQQISFLKENHFQFVSLRDVMERNDLDKNSVLLTFDDGYLDHYLNVFPILVENGISGLFSMPAKIIREKKVLDVNKIHFILASAHVLAVRDKLFVLLNKYRPKYGGGGVIPPNEELYQKLARQERYDDLDTVFIKSVLQKELPEKLRNQIVNELFEEFVSDNEAMFVDELYMNMDQIRFMKRSGMEFGLHGYEHYWMNRLTDDELRTDTEKALETFDGIVNVSDWSYIYPYGSYSDQVITIARSMGATSGFGTEVAVYNPDCDNAFKIPRMDTNDFPPKSRNYLEFC